MLQDTASVRLYWPRYVELTRVLVSAAQTRLRTLCKESTVHFVRMFLRDGSRHLWPRCASRTTTKLNYSLPDMGRSSGTRERRTSSRRTQHTMFLWVFCHASHRSRRR